MTDGTSASVECPLCEAAFDPTAAGGWCTNPECGEWQYSGEEVPAPAETESVAEGGHDAATGTDESDPTPAIRRVGAEPGDAADEALTEDSPDGTGGVGAGSEALDSARDDPGTDADDAAGSVQPEGGQDAHSCPECASPVDAADSFCASCGADLDALGTQLDSCPTCDADVDATDSFCANCGEDLEAARTAADSTEASDASDTTEASDPSDSTEASDSNERTGTPDAEGATASTAGQDAATGSQGASGSGQALTSPAESDAGSEALVLRARGESVTVGDGETVGREIRNLVTETGGETDDAVLIHREHVRFVSEDDCFYLVDLGDNPTAVNGSRLSKGDREPVAPGDEIELSGVVTLTVEAP